MIPNIFHFVFVGKPLQQGENFGLSHYIAVKSAIDINNPLKTYFHYCEEPVGVWWQKAKPLLSLNKIEKVTAFMGNPVPHPAHQSDIIRLQMLLQYGGIYLDLDTICIKPLTPFLPHKFVIGLEAKAPYQPKNWRQKIKYQLKKNTGRLKEPDADELNFCSGVLLSEKGSSFVSKWLMSYTSFRSKGKDKYWNEHSGIISRRLSKENADLLNIAGPRAFHFPLYDKQGLTALFEELHSYPEAYIHHVWESFSWEKYLSKLTPEIIKTTDTTYNCYARKFL